jgi:hypothetical protein
MITVETIAAIVAVMYYDEMTTKTTTTTAATTQPLVQKIKFEKINLKLKCNGLD